MSAQASIAIIAIAAMLLCSFAKATTIDVRGATGWDFGIGDWQNGQTLKTGDVLVFSYNPSFHNVVIVSKENYDPCTAFGTLLTSGHDQVTLTNGTSYYICGFHGHCAQGVKATVTAL